MPDVTFNAVTIPFGKVISRPHEYALKTWGFPGVDDLEFLPMGMRGRSFLVKGRSVNGGITKATLEAFVDGAAHALVDGESTSFGDCICLGVSYLRQYTDQDGFAFEFRLSIFQVVV